MIAIVEPGACLEGLELEYLVVVLDGDGMPEVRGGVEPGLVEEPQSCCVSSSAMIIVSSRILRTFSLGVISKSEGKDGLWRRRGGGVELYKEMRK